MKRFLQLILAIFFALNLSAQENGEFFKGRVISSENGEAIYYAMIKAGAKSYFSDSNGEFFIPKNDETLKVKVITVSKENYSIATVNLTENMNVSLDPNNSEQGSILLTIDELESDEGYTQSTPGLLYSSGDAYSSFAGYNWGSYWFRVRGYQNENIDIYIDGINMQLPERGYATFSMWGGLNDVTRNREATYNIAPTKFGFSKIGGSINTITKASEQRPGFKASYSFANSSYSNRLMLTYSSGLMNNGWAYTVSGSRRWAQEGYAEGTPYDAYSAFIGVEKKFNSNHSLQLSAFVSPQERGQISGSVKEALVLRDNNLYNPYWGFQSGDKRNSRMRKMFMPQFILNHDIGLGENMKLKTAIGYRFGLDQRTALNWYDAADPRPDYYRYLPSYSYNAGNTAIGDLLTSEWQQGDIAQINWQNLYDINRNSYEDYKDLDGQITSGNRAHYFIEERNLYSTKFDFNPTLIWNLSDKLEWVTGVQYMYYNGNSYNALGDLLGADYFVDIDNFAERDFVDPNMAINDLNDSSLVKKVGDRIGSDYDANITTTNLWSHLKLTQSAYSLYFGVNGKLTEMYRYGNRKKGLFPNDSYGQSEIMNFKDYGVKLGGEYYLNGRNVISLNSSYYTQAPFFQDVFVSVRTRNETIENIESAKVLSGDLNYYFRGEKLNFRLSGFYTQMTNVSDVISYYDDSYNSFVNYALNGIATENTGVEVGIQYNFTQEFRIKAAGTYASYTYIDNPSAKITIDNNAQVLADNEKVYFNGRFTGGTPMMAGSVSAEYWSKDYWFLIIGANFLADRFVTLNPARYTDRAVENVIVGSDQYNDILRQERLDDAFTVDVSAGKSWKIGKYMIRLNLNLTNVLNNQNIVTTGYQQYRFDFIDKNAEKFPNKYYYAQGFRAFINLGFSF